MTELSDILEMLKRVQIRVHPSCDDITLFFRVSNPDILYIDFLWVKHPKNLYYRFVITYQEMEQAVNGALENHIVNTAMQVYSKLEK